MAFDDYTSRTVRLVDLIFFIVLFLFFKKPSFGMLLLCCLLFLVVWWGQRILHKEWAAFADSVLLGLLPLGVDLQSLPAFLVILGILLITYHVMTKTEKAPFITAYFLTFFMICFFDKGGIP